MKKIFLCLVLVFILICIPTLTLASSGTAVIPHLIWYSLNSTYYSQPWIFISNITGDQINIKLTIFDYNGAIFKSYLTTDSANALNFTTNVSDASVSFNLNAYTSCRVYFAMPTNNTWLNYGFGKISWSSNNYLNTTPGVIAELDNVYQLFGGSTAAVTITPINNGLPF